MLVSWPLPIGRRSARKIHCTQAVEAGVTADQLNNIWIYVVVRVFDFCCERCDIK